MQDNLDTLIRKTVCLLKETRSDYFFIGGLAVGLLGEPRMTQDIDLILFVGKEELRPFIKKAKKLGFKCNEKMTLYDASSKGAFKLVFGLLWVDIIIASTEFEQSALARRSNVRFIESEIFLPSPEDFILLKIIPGRDKDILDAKTVVSRHKNKLDKRYLRKWAQALSDEAEDMRIWNTMQNLLA